MTQQNRQRAIILGGTSGIGLAAAITLKQKGLEVIVTGRGAERANRVRQEHPQIRVEQTDAGSEESLIKLYQQVENFDHLVICVSGAKGGGTFASLSLNDLHEGFNCKFFLHVLAAKLALPYLSKTGSITFVSAISARAANPGTSGLAAINGAIEAMVKPLARELKPLRVNAVSPGVVETPWWDQLPAGLRDQLLQQSSAASCVGRNGTPEDLGHAIEFVVTNGFVTGTVIEIDGGLRLS